MSEELDDYQDDEADLTIDASSSRENAFDRAGIRWLTPSSLNEWDENPAYWAATRLMGIKKSNKSSPAMARGKAINAGAGYFLFKRNASAAEDFALRAFEAEALSPSPETNKEMDAILPMLGQVMPLLEAYPIPVGQRIGSEIWVDGIGAPFASWPGFIFPDATVLDIKSTHRCPKSIPVRDQRSMSVHSLSRGANANIVYVTMKTIATYELTIDQLKSSECSLIRDASSIQNFLNSVDSAEEAIRILPLRPSHWLWTPEILKTVIARAGINHEGIAHERFQSAAREKLQINSGRNDARPVLPGHRYGNAEQ